MKTSIFSVMMIATLFFSVEGFAYTPPAPFIVGQMVKGREKLKTLEMEGSIVGPDSNSVVKEVTQVDFASGKVVSTYISESGEALGTHANKIQNLAPMGRAWIGLGMDPYANRVRNTLESLGALPSENTEVKIERSSASSTNNIVWTWGEGSRLKVLKDQFAFAGYQSADQAIDVKEYTSKNTTYILPKTVSVKTGEYTYTLKTFRSNAPLKPFANNEKINSPMVRGWVELVR